MTTRDTLPSHTWKQVRGLRLHLPKLQAARVASGDDVRGDEDPLSVKLAVLVRLHAQVAPGAYPRLHALRHTCEAAPPTGVRSIRKHAFDDSPFAREAEVG